MSMTYQELQDEVKRRGTLNESGSEFTTAVATSVNAALLSIAREGNWRVLRRSTSINTVAPYTTGTGAVTVTNGSATVTVTGATFLTDGIQIGRRIKISGSSLYYKVATITGETTLTLNQTYSGTSSTTATYEILGQEEYVLPPQVNHRMFLWHEKYGYPYKLTYMTDQDFFNQGLNNTEQNVPLFYRMWGTDWVLSQVKSASVVTISSSSSSDVNIPVTIFGIVSGYPDYEVITTNSSNGTTATAGSKSFTSIERVSAGASRVGRITVTTNSGNNTVAVIPVGDTTSGIQYSKIQLWPLPDSAFPLNVWYYKEPYKLVNTNDIHELGQEFDEAIILLATAKIKGETDIQDGAGTFYQMYLNELKNLKKTNIDKIDFFADLRRPYTRGFLMAAPNLAYQQIQGGQFGPRVF